MSRGHFVYAQIADITICKLTISLRKDRLTAAKCSCESGNAQLTTIYFCQPPPNWV